MSGPRKRICKGCKYFRQGQFWCPWLCLCLLVLLEGMWAHSYWAGQWLRKTCSLKTQPKSYSSSLFFFSRKPICWFQPPSGEGIVSAEAPRRCGGFLTLLIASWWFRSWAIVPWLQWCHQFEPALEIPATPPQSLAHPNPVAQMPSLNRRLVWWHLPSACLRKPPGHTN